MSLTLRRLLLVFVIAVLLRAWAILLLPTDFDEPIYLRAAFDYARALKAGDLDGVIDYPENREHPALIKLLYGVEVLTLGRADSFQSALIAGRALSAVFGVLAVLLVTLIGGPLAGGMLAVHTLAVKYTSQAYLEGLPLFASTAAILAFVRYAPTSAPFARRPHPEWRPERAQSKGTRTGERAGIGIWYWLSALALGLTAAGKLAYAPVVVVVILYLATWERNLQWRAMLLYFAVAAIVFFLLNPTLWHNPLSRLGDALFFHLRYSQGADVRRLNYPWYQPFIWVSTSAPSGWHPDVFFYFGFDGAIFWLALAGLRREWRERRWLVVWLVSGLFLLLLWPTKWPQYALVVTPALCLAAAETGVRIYHWLKEQEMYWQWLPQMLPQISRATWIVLGLFVAFLAVVYLSALLAVSLGSIGWSHLSAGSTLLPSNTVYDILPLPDGRVILGTERGAALWSPPPASDLPDRWVVFNHQNSGLPSSRVLALARDDAGTLWFGTEAGLSRYDEAAAAWQTYRAADLGLSGDQVRALAFANDGRLWVGTQTGAATWDGRAWTTYTTANSGLADDHVFALVVAPEGSVTWFGTLRGVSRLDTQTGAWRTFTTADSDLGAAGVSDLLIDSTGRVWAATTGGGLSVWDGATWRTYRAGTDSLPFSTVNALFEAPAGTIWAASSASMDVGGALASFDGKMWRTYLPRNSGFSGAEPLSFALDDRGRLWIGTRTKGVDIYQLSK